MEEGNGGRPSKDLLISELEGELREAKKDLEYGMKERGRLVDEIADLNKQKESLKIDFDWREEQVRSLEGELRQQQSKKAPLGIIGNVIIIGNLISGAAGLIIIFAVIFIAMFSEREVPKVLENWGGIVIGFYFGSFMGLIKDFMAKAPAPAEEAKAPSG